MPRCGMFIKKPVQNRSATHSSVSQYLNTPLSRTNPKGPSPCIPAVCLNLLSNLINTEWKNQSATNRLFTGGLAT